MDWFIDCTASTVLCALWTKLQWMQQTQCIKKISMGQPWWLLASVTQTLLDTVWQGILDILGPNIPIVDSWISWEMFPTYRYSPCLSRFEPVELTILSKYSMTIQALCLLTVLSTPLYCCFFKADCCPHGLCLSGVMLCEDLHQIWETWRDTVRWVFILSKFHLTRYLNGIWHIFYVLLCTKITCSDAQNHTCSAASCKALLSKRPSDEKPCLETDPNTTLEMKPMKPIKASRLAMDYLLS